ncbi:hypothetical protein E2C01_060352 [Portunus trituberculatus]|uniref:Uncharacterized protein n=1 Tax=Portunus trituberculatus TaxID=210409 RepID=A0A5B7H8H0_PORTR|nr:hypothetical protein [Portunus trituberculatus]
MVVVVLPVVQATPPDSLLLVKDFEGRSILEGHRISL